MFINKCESSQTKETYLKRKVIQRVLQQWRRRRRTGKQQVRTMRATALGSTGWGHRRVAWRTRRRHWRGQRRGAVGWWQQWHCRAVLLWTIPRSSSVCSIRIAHTTTTTGQCWIATSSWASTWIRIHRGRGWGTSLSACRWWFNLKILIFLRFVIIIIVINFFSLFVRYRAWACKCFQIFIVHQCLSHSTCGWCPSSVDKVAPVLK